MKTNLDKGRKLFNFFSDEYTAKGLSNFLEGFKISGHSIEQLSASRFLIKTNEKINKLESCLALIDIKISNYSVKPEGCEYIIEVSNN